VPAICLRLAVSNENGKVVLHSSYKSSAANTIIDNPDNLNSTEAYNYYYLDAKKIYVQSKKLDTIVKQFKIKPDLIKIDVEGAEVLVLKGMNFILKNIKPVVFCEISEGNLPEIKNMLAKNGYILKKITKQDYLILSKSAK
jgi:FkbM family methyltransferase